MIYISTYEKMTAEECWETYGWGCEARLGSTVYHRWTDAGDEVFCDMLREEYDVDGKPVFGCEIYEGGDMVGQWFADSPLDAIRGAVVDSVGFSTMRGETCCEDAVNVISYRAYVKLFGPCKLSEMDRDEMDALMGIAREFVKAHVKWVDYGWEEY